MRNFFFDENGYPRFKNTGRLVHRVVAAGMFGKKVLRGMVVHHIDGVKTNFRKGNLQPLTRSAHALLHVRQRKLVGILSKSKKFGLPVVALAILIASVGSFLRIASKKDNGNDSPL